MSASREKKTREDLNSSGWTDPKTAREAQQRKEAKRSNMVYAAIAVIFVLVAVVSLTWKSNIIQKSATAATINGEKYGVAEVNFYYQNMLSQNAYYLYAMGVDTSDLKNAMISEDQSWHDLLVDQAFQQLMLIQALNDKAAAENFTWTDAMQAQLDSTMQGLKDNATSQGISVSQLLSSNFGGTMTEKIYEELMHNAILAQAYSDAYADTLSYTLEDLEAAYAEDTNRYDRVSYESVRFSGSVPTTDKDGNKVEVTDEMKEQAMADAKAAADKLYASYLAGGSLEALAESDENAAYAASESSAYSGDALGDWLFDSARKAGDSIVLEDKDTSACFVVHFRGRERRADDVVDVRHILCKVDSASLDKESETYEQDLQALKDAAKAQAEELLAQWQSGEATEESFAALASEKSQDPGSAADGGLIPAVASDSNYVDTFKNWCLEDGRQVGDTGIVESEYGYHIMYCVSMEPYWQYQATTDLKGNAISEWRAQQTADYTVEQGSGMKYVG